MRRVLIGLLVAPLHAKSSGIIARLRPRDGRKVRPIAIPCLEGALCATFVDRGTNITTLPQCAHACQTQFFSFWNKNGARRHEKAPATRCRCCTGRSHRSHHHAPASSANLFYDVYNKTAWASARRARSGTPLIGNSNATDAAVLGCPSSASAFPFTLQEAAARVRLDTLGPCPASYRPHLATLRRMFDESEGRRLPPPKLIEAVGSSFEQFLRAVMDALSTRSLGTPSLPYLLYNNFTEPVIERGHWLLFGASIWRTLKALVSVKRVAGVYWSGEAGAWWRPSPKPIHYFATKPKPAPYPDDMVEWHIGAYKTTAAAFAKNRTTLLSRLLPVLREKIDLLYLRNGDSSAWMADVFPAIEHLLASGAYVIFDHGDASRGFDRRDFQALYKMLLRTRRKVRVIGHSGPGRPSTPLPKPYRGPFSIIDGQSNETVRRAVACYHLSTNGGSDPFLHDVAKERPEIACNMPADLARMIGRYNGCYGTSPLIPYRTKHDAVVQIL